MKFILTTDTSCDCFKHELDAQSIPWIPLTYTLDGVEYSDDYVENSQYQAFYDKLATGAMPTTSQINPASHEEFFEKVLAQHNMDIIHLTLSGGLSETVNSARVAAKNVMEKHTQRKIYIVDTLAATQAHHQILDYATALREDFTAEEAVTKIEKYRMTVQAWFMVNDLHHLKRGGRVSAFAATFGTMLKIKPILTINHEGRLAVVKKIKGHAAAINYFLEIVEANKADKNSGAFYIVNANAHTFVEQLKEKLKEKYPNCPIKGGWIGPVIGAHTGGGTFGIIFEAKSRPTDK